MAELGLGSSSITPEMIPGLRAAPPMPEDISQFDSLVERRDVTVPGFGAAEITLSVFSPVHRTGPGPGIFAVHGGGMIMGDRLTGISLVLPWVIEHGAVAVTAEYRLAPEFPDPAPVEDCYAALVWMAEHAEEIGIDRARILLAGASAGGGLAAGTALLARDRNGPAILGQLLSCPMLDDRDATASTAQFDGVGAWDRTSNRTGWCALLGDRVAGPDVSIYAAPARAHDLAGLPPTFIDVGSAEVFRDEDVRFASQIWSDGGEAELHVWPGGTHGWEAFAAGTQMARQASEARSEWVRRILNRPM